VGPGLDGMEDVQFALQPVRQHLRGLDDGVVQRLSLAVDMGGIHAGDDAPGRPVAFILREQQGRRTGADELPVPESGR